MAKYISRRDFLKGTAAGAFGNPMKKMIAMILSVLLLLTAFGASAFAESDSAGAPPSGEMPGEPPEGTPPGDPPGGMGTPPGGFGGRNGADGDGTTLYIYDTAIITTGDGSGGIMTTGGGVTYAYDLDVTTSGRSSAAIRTDRGGGTVVVDGGTYTSNGLGSPAIYSTTDITVSNAVLISNLSEGVCIEGLNSITLTDCDLTANNTSRNGNATFLDTIMISVHVR